MLKDDHLPPRRLRLAMVATSLRLAGAEKQTVYLARALHDAGVDVHFFYLGGGGYYETVLRQLGVPLCQIHAPNRPWAILARLIGALHRLRPDIVLVSQFGDLVYGVPAGRCCRALTLGCVRSDGFYELNTRGRLSPWLFRVTDGFIANSYCAKENLIGRGIKPQKMEVLPNVIDLRDFDARRFVPLDIALPSKRVIVAAVGSLHPGKRFDRFIDALALAQHREPALAGVIVGADRGAKTALNLKAKSLGLTENDLMFVGECDRVPALLARAGILVLTSEYEGFPNVILEAMAAGLPVVTTPAGDAARIVQHGKTGYVAEMDDIQGLSASIVQLAQSPALRKQLGEAARKRVEQHYNYDGLVDRLMALFQTFAARTGRASLRNYLMNPFSCAPCPA